MALRIILENNRQKCIEKVYYFNTTPHFGEGFFKFDIIGGGGYN
jgi:hypothetical protein